MITETRTEDGFWRYDGDGRTEVKNTSVDGRYTYAVIHCEMIIVPKRLSDADIARLFEGEPCSRAAA